MNDEIAVIVKNGKLVPFNFVFDDIIKGYEGEHLVLKVVDVSAEKARTSAQNAALHVYCRELAKALADGGYDLVGILKEFKAIEITPTMENIKDTVWKPIQTALLGKDSTTKLDTSEVNDVYRQVDRFTSSKFKVSIPFPDGRAGR